MVKRTKKKPETDTKKKIKLGIGDRVRIKSWEEMEKTYGIDEYGYIDLPLRFSPMLKKYCGSYATISSYDIDDNTVHLSDCTHKDDALINTVYIYVDALELATDEPCKFRKYLEVDNG